MRQERLMRDESIKSTDLFKFDYFKCLRSEFAKSECSICIDLCPEEAMVFDRAKLTLDTSRCTACAACMGSCPTEALISEAFDPNRFVIEFSKEKNRKISCKENVPCIAALSSEHLIAMALRKDSEIVCDLAHCKECSLNGGNRVLETIEKIIEEAERFLQISGSTKRIECQRELLDDAPKAARRGLLKRVANIVGDMNEDDTMAELASLGGEKQPLRRILLKNSLKLEAQNLSQETAVGADFSFVVNKRIDESTCTNCQECAMFCPTEALTILQDNTGIVFQMGKCIACSICNEVCKPGSILNDGAFDPVEFAFDRMELLVKHKLEICEECKVAFAYRGGEKVCDRCRDFKENFSDLFTMAKDIEC